MGIKVSAGRDASVKAGRDINVNGRVDEDILAQILGLLDDHGRATGKQDLAERVKVEVQELAAEDDGLAHDAAQSRVMELAVGLGPAVIAALAQLLPKLFV